jgi:hypothetical protein
MALLSTLNLQHSTLMAQGTAFTYQGRLAEGTNAARGIYDLRFALCDSPAGPNVLGTVTSNGVPVNNGLFTVTLDFGSGVFDGGARWLEMGVRTNGSTAAYVTLSPRQPISPTPYAIHAANATLFDGQGTNAFAPATGSANYVANALSSGLEGTGAIAVWNSLSSIGAVQLAWDGSNSRLGVGTTSPRYKLHVSEPTAADVTTLALEAEGRSSEGAINRILFRTGTELDLATRNIASIAAINSNAGSHHGSLSFSTMEAEILTEKMRITPAGNIGIGTPTPESKLDVAGDLSVQGNLKLTSGVGSSGAGRLQVISPGDVIGLTLNSGTRVWDLVSITSSSTEYFAIQDHTVGSTRFRITENGNVAIGDQLPQAKLDVLGDSSSAPVAIFRQAHLSNHGFVAIDSPTDSASRPSFISLRRGGAEKWSVGGIYESDSFGIGTDVNLPNQKVVVTPNGSVGIGTTSPQAKLHVAGDLRTSILTITGGADVAEPFPISGGDIPKGAVLVIDSQNPGQLKQSERAYDKRVAGIVSGANGIQPGITLHQEGALEGTHQVALSGRVYALADAARGAIEPGDLLTTSDTPGHCMRVTDSAQAQGAILGKAMSRLEAGKGLVLVLVTLQ